MANILYRLANATYLLLLIILRKQAIARSSTRYLYPKKHARRLYNNEFGVYENKTGSCK